MPFIEEGDAIGDGSIGTGVERQRRLGHEFLRSAGKKGQPHYAEHIPKARLAPALLGCGTAVSGGGDRGAATRSRLRGQAESRQGFTDPPMRGMAVAMR